MYLPGGSGDLVSGLVFTSCYKTYRIHILGGVLGGSGGGA